MWDGENNFSEIQNREELAYIHDKYKLPTRWDVVNYIDEHLKPKTVLDLGAGQVKYPFNNVVRVDGNPQAEPDILADLAKPFQTKKADLVFSIEVAEHIPKESAFIFADNLANNSNKWILMTTCPPKDKHSAYEVKAHLNEQPISYWAEKLKAKGFIHQVGMSNEMMKHFQGIKEAMPWFKYNLAIFKCAESK
jgi:hypothetical protein